MCNFKLRENLYIIFFKRFRTRFNRELNDSVDDKKVHDLNEHSIFLIYIINDFESLEAIL